MDPPVLCVIEKKNTKNVGDFSFDKRKYKRRKDKGFSFYLAFS